MKKLLTVVMAVLALNFLAAAGGVGFLFKTGRLDKDKVKTIKEIVLATQPTTQEADATTKPTKLEELTAKKLGRSTVEQVELAQESFRSQAAELDRRAREVADLKNQVDMAQRQVDKDRADLKAQQAAFAKTTEQAKLQEGDKGFDDALALYSAMPAKQAKAVFAGLDDATLRKYLQAMEPRAATKIIKEFKTPDEIKRIQQVVEGIRLGTQKPQPPAPDGTTAAFGQ